MEQDGWDYSNILKDRRNIFLFRDSCHRNLIIQNRLLEEIDLKIRKKSFQTLFTEGDSGIVKSLNFPDWMNETDVKKYLDINCIGWSAVEILSYRNENLVEYKDLQIIGAEDPNAFNKHKAIVREIAGTVKKIMVAEKDEDIKLYFSKLKALHRKSRPYIHERSKAAVKNLVSIMNRNQIENAGLLFGEGHYELITQLLKQEDIGYSSFYPGKIKPNLEENIDYLMNF